MLAPDSRIVATALLRPPPGYRLDHAVLTAYTLDLETLLALPFGVLSRSDADFRTLLGKPLQLLEALRSEARRFHVFVDHGGISIPRTHRTLYGMLEECVTPVRAPNGGVFHPKVWIARFVKKHDASSVLLRVGVLSRNLTDDRSWDVALTSEASPGDQSVEASRALSQLLRDLPALATESAPEPTRGPLRVLAEETARTRFPPPAGFRERPLRFHLLGLGGNQDGMWRPTGGGARLLAIAPFVNLTALDHLRRMCPGERILVSRQDALDRVPEEALTRWGAGRIRTLRENALAETEETEDGAQPAEMGRRPSGLHAKLIAVENGCDVTWYVGSANLTQAAFKGHNVELMVEARARKGHEGGKSGRGIEPFLEGRFLDLCAPYRRNEAPDADPQVTEARRRLDEAGRALLEAALHIRCTPNEEGYRLKIEGELSLASGIECFAWPVSLSDSRALSPAPSWVWRLPETHLTAFIAFRLRCDHPEVEDLHLTRKLPAYGLPETRLNAVLRSLIDSPERLLEFLRALLGGIEGLADMGVEHRTRGGDLRFEAEGFAGETLLEDLLRAVSRDPERLKPIRRLIADLRETEEGRKLLPGDLLAIWDAVDGVACDPAS